MRPASRVTSPLSSFVRRLRALAIRISDALRRLAARRPPELASPRAPSARGIASTATVAREPRHLPSTRPALAAVHASVASAIGDHVSLQDFTVRHVGHLVEVSVHVGPTNRRFVVDSRDDDFVLRLQARLLTALPRSEGAG
ncbi:MAG: hypothetical protein JNL83_03755 [Myxococcales bacterium]|nr:hypothetical protein [Myxococcales bacterium]